VASPPTSVRDCRDRPRDTRVPYSPCRLSAPFVFLSRGDRNYVKRNHTQNEPTTLSLAPGKRPLGVSGRGSGGGGRGKQSVMVGRSPTRPHFSLSSRLLFPYRPRRSSSSSDAPSSERRLGNFFGRNEMCVAHSSVVRYSTRLAACSCSPPCKRHQSRRLRASRLTTS